MGATPGETPERLRLTNGVAFADDLIMPNVDPTWIPIAAFEDAAEAEACLGHLTALRVQAIIRAVESPARATVGMAVLVAADEAATAREALGIGDTETTIGLYCPDCGSGDLIYGFSQRFNRLARIFAFLAMSPELPRKTQCLDCGAEFLPPEEW